MSVTVTRDNTKRVAETIAKLARLRLMVGVPATNAERRSEPGEPHDITNAAIGYIMENGAPEVGIPARPHLRVSIEAMKDEIITRLGNAGKAAFVGRDPEDEMNVLGLRAQAKVRAKIQSGPFIPLAPATISARKRRGHTGTKPLIETGQYRNSINYVIRKMK